MQQDDKLITVTELASRWGVSRQTVYRIVNDGELKIVRIRGQFRIRMKDVEEYEERRNAKH